MSESKSLAESLFEDLLQQADKSNELIKTTKPIELSSNIDSIVTNDSFEEDEDLMIDSADKKMKITKSITPVHDIDEDPLHILHNLKLMKTMKKCRVKLPKIGQKKLSQMIKKTIKKKNIKTTKKNLNKSNNKMSENKSVVRLSRVDIDLDSKNISISSEVRKRKSTDSSIQSTKAKKRSSAKTKIFIKFDSPSNQKKSPTLSSSSSSPIYSMISSNKRSLSPTLQQNKTTISQQKKTIDKTLLTKGNLEESFGRQFFKCRVRVNKVRSLDNLNITDIEMELDRKEKRKLRKKAKGLNKSVSFVETVEVFGESDSEDNVTSDLNKDIIELDASTEETNDGAGGDDGNKVIDNMKKKLNDEMIENGDISENVFKDNDDIMVSTPKEKLNISPGKIGRIRKSFSPLKSEEDQQSPRSKLLRKGDEKIVRIPDLILDDDDNIDLIADDNDELKDKNVTNKLDNNDDNGKIKLIDNTKITITDDDNDDNVEILNKENDSSLKSCLDDSEVNLNQETDLEKSLNDEKNEKQTKTLLLMSDQYESLSSDDSKDFADAKENENISGQLINIDGKKIKDDVVIRRIEINADEDDDYYLPKPKISKSDNNENKMTDNKENENRNDDDDDDDDDDVETIDKIMSSVNEEISIKLNEKVKCNVGDESNDIFEKSVEPIDMLNSDTRPSQSSPVQFGEELKLSEDENSRNVLEKELNEITKITTTTTTKKIDKSTTITTTSSSSPITSSKFSFNTFLKSSLQTIKTRILSDSPKLSTSQEPQKNISDISDDDDDDVLPPQAILLDETDDESSALLGDPVLGGREMTD